MEKNILFVDDDQGVLEVIGERIKSWGYQLFRASGGKEALSIINEEEIDIIILDYMMPELDGLKTLKKIRKINKNIPVIMFTAYPDQKSIKGSENLGVSAYVPKMNVSSNSITSLRTSIDLVSKKIDKDRAQ